MEIIPFRFCKFISSVFFLSLTKNILAVKKTNEARLRNYDQAEDSAFMQVMIYYACICK